MRREIVETHNMRSACRVRLPKRCVENIIVLFPRNFRSRENRSIKEELSGPNGHGTDIDRTVFGSRI